MSTQSSSGQWSVVHDHPAYNDLPIRITAGPKGIGYDLWINFTSKSSFPADAIEARTIDPAREATVNRLADNEAVQRFLALRQEANDLRAKVAEAEARVSKLDAERKTVTHVNAAGLASRMATLEAQFVHASDDLRDLTAQSAALEKLLPEARTRAEQQARSAAMNAVNAEHSGANDAVRAALNALCAVAEKELTVVAAAMSAKAQLRNGDQAGRIAREVLAQMRPAASAPVGAGAA